MYEAANSYHFETGLASLITTRTYTIACCLESGSVIVIIIIIIFYFIFTILYIVYCIAIVSLCLSLYLYLFMYIVFMMFVPRYGIAAISVPFLPSGGFGGFSGFDSHITIPSLVCY